MISNLENDMSCLVDSLEFLKDDIPQRIQALEHLADMCLQDNGSILLNKTSGLSAVFKIAFNKKTPQVVLQKALVTLGNACLANDDNKGILCSDQVLQFLHDALLTKEQTVQSVASSTYFLACLCTNNEKAQHKARKSMCLEKLVALYRYYHPKGNVENSEVEEWFEKADINSPLILNHISHALKAVMNKPRNPDNQMVCSRLLNLAISTLLSASNSNDSKNEALQFISDCIFENEKTQRIFHMIGGIRFISQCIRKELSSNTKKGILPAILDTLSVAVSDNNNCKKSAGEADIVKYLLDCLARKDITNTIHLKCLMCLSEIVHECSFCQEKFVQCDGAAIVIGIMSKKQDEITSKIGTSILQSCIQNLSDQKGPDSETEEAEQSSSFSNLLNFFSGKKRKEGRKTKREGKTLKNLLRSLESNDNVPSQQMKDLIKHIETGTEKEQQKSNLRGANQNHEKKSGSVATSNTKVNNEMMKMLKEQNQILKTFKSDISNLRAEITSQASDCGGSHISRPDQSFVSTPHRHRASNTQRISSTPSRVVYHQQHCPGTAPAKSCNAQHRPAVQAVTPLHNNSTSFVSVNDDSYRHNHRKNSTTENTNNYCSGLPMTFDSEHDASWHKGTTSSLILYDENDERPALAQTLFGAGVMVDRSTLSSTLFGGIAPMANNKVDFSISNQSLDNSIQQVPEFKVPDVIEKVQRWREQTQEHKHEFKVPVLTPLLKRRRLELKVKTPKEKSEHQQLTPTGIVKTFERNCEDLKHAPKKKLSSKRRRPTSPDEGYVDHCYTPEQQEVHQCDETKRTLNFEGLAVQRRIEMTGATRKEDDKQNVLEKGSSSSGFIDASSKSSQSYPRGVSCGDESFSVGKLCMKNVKRCIGCYPFQRRPLLLVNSRNIMSIMQKVGCEFHIDALKKKKQLLRRVKKDMLSMEDVNESSNTSDCSQPKQKISFKDLDSCSVFSFRLQRDDECSESGSVCSRQTACTNTSIARRRRQEYSEEEVRFILQGIERYGTRWKAILNTFPFKPGRQSDDLRSKYKQMKRKKELPRSQRMERHPFTTQELVLLRRGVFKHDQNWDVILDSFDFLPQRTAIELKDTWETLLKNYR